MPRSTSSTLPTLLVLAVACVAPTDNARADSEDTDTVYRCTDARGRVGFQDSPCPRGQQQQVKELMHPKPPPPAPAVAAPRSATMPAPPTTPQIVVIQAPQPLYECITPDGATYTSASDAGNPRWVPLWTLNYPSYAETTVVTPGSVTLGARNGRVDARIRSGGIQRAIVPTIAGYGAGTWVRDACHALPQVEACARMRDELDALRDRFFNAMPSERDQINVRERGLVARLDNDCGGH